MTKFWQIQCEKIYLNWSKFQLNLKYSKHLKKVCIRNKIIINNRRMAWEHWYDYYTIDIHKLLSIDRITTEWIITNTNNWLLR